MGLRFVPFVFWASAALALFAACNGQSEGDICDPRNGNNDCQNGYACTAPMAPYMGNRCCPGDLSLATAPACKVGVAAIDASTAAPGAGADDAASVDAAPDAAAGDSAAVVDAASDGPTE
jgi:hypothetical protein